MLEFITAGRYRVLDPVVLPEHIELINDDNTFIVAYIDSDGFAYTPECTFKGQQPLTNTGWCVSVPSLLKCGLVELVEGY